MKAPVMKAPTMKIPLDNSCITAKDRRMAKNYINTRELGTNPNYTNSLDYSYSLSTGMCWRRERPFEGANTKGCWNKWNNWENKSPNWGYSTRYHHFHKHTFVRKA